MRRLALVVALALVLPGFQCKLKPSAESYVYSVFVDETAAKVESLEVGGKPAKLATQYPQGKSFEVTLPAAEFLVEMPAAVVMTTTCGATKIPGKLTVGLTRTDSRSGEERERGLLAKGKNDLTAEVRLSSPPRLADVFVDTDGAVGAQVLVGVTPVDPSKSPHRVAMGPCATGDDVKIGAASVGKLAVAPRKMADKPDAPGTAFIDAKGGHCYEKKLHVYVDERENTANMARGAPERLEGKRVYTVEIDDFLKPSPETLTSKEAFPTRTEIRRCASAASAPKPKPKKK